MLYEVITDRGFFWHTPTPSRRAAKRREGVRPQARARAQGAAEGPVVDTGAAARRAVLLQHRELHALFLAEREGRFSASAKRSYNFV